MSSSFASSQPFPKPLTVLVVDDDTATRLTLRDWLQQSGHSVVCANSGNDALRVLRTLTPDLVITEVIMVEGDGLEVMLELRRRQVEARVMAISGGGRYLPAADTLKLAKRIGAHEVMQKPLAREPFALALERLIASPEPVPAG